MPEEVPFVSSIRSAPSITRKPSDLLDERSVFVRRFTRGHEPPTIDDLMKHADRYGTEQVVETAAELGYGVDSCVRLMDHCDRIDAAEFKKSYPHRKPARLKTSEARCNLLLGIEDEEDEDAEKNKV